MKSIAEALEAMLPVFSRLESETIALEDARGRYLAADVQAAFDSPPFDNSAMDGYAVRFTDVERAESAQPVRLPVKGESRAGGPIPAPLEPSTACRIFTGAPLPVGANAVVIQEDTERDGDDVLIRESSSEWKHVRRQGSDLRAASTMLTSGTRLHAGEVGLLASQNVSEVDVVRKPRIAILSTGDELRPLGSTLEPGSIVNSNAYALEALVRDLGADPVRLPIVPDDLDALTECLRTALKHDVVISTGGVSVGEYDMLHKAFEAAGIDTTFWKVRIKPGKPISFGVRDGVPVVGLPGNPISAMVTFEVFVAPCVRKMLGDPRPHPEPIRAKLTAPYRRRPGRVEVARGHVTTESGEARVTLLGRQGSGSLTSFVAVNALVVLSADKSEWIQGEEVDVLLWGPGLRGPDSVFTGY